LCTTLPQGAALCLYTDGLVEVRRDGDQYGEDRLDAALAAARELSAQALVEHVVEDCRAFAGEPEDDYAVVVIRRPRRRLRRRPQDERALPARPSEMTGRPK
jgi:serine phosphatase RsbU (regulator of sigma subunit)